MAIYERDNPNRAPFVFKDIVIGDTNELTEIDVSSIPDDFLFGAVYVNHGDHGYAKVRFDSLSISWFTKNLGYVRDHLTRACIWRYFWILVMDGQLSSLDYLAFVKRQLPLE